jgi:hypothetical protein
MGYSLGWPVSIPGRTIFFFLHVLSSKRTRENGLRRLQVTDYKRVGHDREIRSRKQRTDIGKHSL